MGMSARMLQRYTLLLNSVACCTFGALLIFLYVADAENTTFSTWHENIVLGTSANLNATIHHVNTTLIQLCAAKNHGIPRMSMPRVGFSLNSTRLSGTVFTAASDTVIDSKSLLALVIVVSFIFHAWRVLVHRAVVQGDDVPRPDESGPDFLRWVEYTLSSPPMIIIICGTLYIRSITEITLLCTLQGALALSGWTIEQLISAVEFEKYQFSNSHRGITHNIYANLGKLAVVFGAAVIMHCVIWFELLTRYLTHEENFQVCALGLAGLPPILGQIVVVECVLFSLFACVPLVQILYIIFVAQTSSSFGVAGLVYSILSLVSKSVLTFLFVKLITDDSCVYTNYGQACM